MPEISMMYPNARGMQLTQRVVEALAPQGARPDFSTLGHLEELAREYIEYEGSSDRDVDFKCEMLARLVLRATGNRDFPPGLFEELTQSILQASEANSTSLSQSSQNEPESDAWLWRFTDVFSTARVPNTAHLFRFCNRGFVTGFIVLTVCAFGPSTGAAIGLVTMGVAVILCLATTRRLPSFILDAVRAVGAGIHTFNAAVREQISAPNRAG